MDKKVIVSYREYIHSLNRCVSCLHNLPSYPTIVDDFFTALLLQASLEYSCISAKLINEKDYEKKEKKNAR